MSDEKSHNDEDRTKTIGYKIGEAFGVFLILCAVFTVGAIVIGAITALLRWMF